MSDKKVIECSLLLLKFIKNIEKEHNLNLRQTVYVLLSTGITICKACQYPSDDLENTKLIDFIKEIVKETDTIIEKTKLNQVIKDLNKKTEIAA